MKTSPRRYHPGLILTFAALLAALPTLRAADDAPPASRKERMQEGADRMADALNLTADQRAKWKQLGEQERTELEAVRADTSLAKEDRRAKAGEIRKKYRDQRQALLTPEQKAKADAMRERFEKRRGEHGEGPPPPPEK